MSEPQSTVPYGYCQCGCGEKTKLASETKASRGWVKGQPLRYINRHSRRGLRKGNEVRPHETLAGTQVMVLGRGFVCLVDEADISWLADYTWRAYSYKTKSDTGRSWTYAVGRTTAYNGVQKQVSMHRLVIGASPGQQVDHKNGNTLDNRRTNLRICTNAQNQHNRHAASGSSRYKGVHWDNGVGKWRASINPGGGTRYIGIFENEEDAARAYDARALHAFGEWAGLNFPDET